MPCFAMICSCSLLFTCSKHCFLMLNPGMLFSRLWTWYLLHFCHACLNLLLCDLAVAKCSSFVKHLEYITDICLVDMLECSSLVSCCILSAFVLLIIVLHHSCFACHLQTVHPFPVIFISISTEIISSFQRHTWFAKLMPCSSSFLPKHAYALHITSRISWHVLHHVACALHRDLLWFLCLCSCFG